MFFKTPLFGTFIFSATLLLIVHFLAINFYLYWQIIWFDLIVHLIGGFTVAVFFIWFIFNFGFLKRRISLSNFLIVSFISSFTVAFLWEIFEIYFNIVLFSDSYILDTVLDIIFGLFGGLFGGLYSFFLINKKYEF